MFCPGIKYKNLKAVQNRSFPYSFYLTQQSKKAKFQKKIINGTKENVLSTKF